MARKIAKSEVEMCCDNNGRVKAGAAGGIYGMAFIGAAVYYTAHADTFWMGVLGILKAIVWPALVIYKVLERLGM